MPSITRVKVSPDLSIADVYVTIMGSEGQQNASLNALRHSAGLMRSLLNKVLSIRQAPFLKFHIDESLKKEIAVLDLLRKVADENAELDRQRAAAQETQSDEGAAPPGAIGTSRRPATRATITERIFHPTRRQCAASHPAITSLPASIVAASTMTATGAPGNISAMPVTEK
jgi:ribosome-binding factor A